MYRRIVVPLDGSALAERALPQAQELARLGGAPLHLVRVVDLTRLEQYGAYGLALEYGGLATVLDDEAGTARAYLDGVAKRSSAARVTATTEVRRGLAARELVAAVRPGDLVVMATHGRGGLSRWLLGSVAEDVVRQAPVPVLLVRTGTEPAAAEPAVAVAEAAA
jgi:nucleotide-binding universal stress UspA family protein